MSTMSPPRPVTADDLVRIPGHYELIEGRLVEMSPAGGQHGRSSMDISAPVWLHARANNLGHCFTAETGFLLATNPDTVLAPDMAFVRNDRLPDPLPAGYLPLAPDLVLETRSPGDSRTDVAAKVQRWLHFGVKVVWTVDPAEKSITIHRPAVAPTKLSVTDALTEPDLLPGFVLPLTQVFW